METLLSSARRSISMEDTASYQRQLIDKISRHQLSVSIPNNPDTPALMPYNGYYTLGNAPGAFFAVDTNMVFVESTPERTFDIALTIFDLTLIVSLDGKSAARYEFTGTFDGTTLTQDGGASGLSVSLTFTRPLQSPGPVASCSGSITLPGKTAVDVSGATWNNPIPASLFAGDYYYVSDSGSTSPVKAMSIGPDNQVYYDNGSNDGQLSPVTVYVYNMNMYYFTFKQGVDIVLLIMGTAAQEGLACNNMAVAGTSLVTRSLRTIPDAQTPAPELFDLTNCRLADFSGYYPIPTAVSPAAFVSIQAQYVTLIPNTNWDLNLVMISVSLDGVTSQGYYFNPFTMSFDGETLKMPEQNITLKLTRKYVPQNGSLVSMSGTINGQTVSSSNLFNPVPLSAFGGAPMTNSAGDTLIVNGDESVTYNGTSMNRIIYVPLMYILAYPAYQPTVVLSFGTDGARGTACIVTEDVNTKSPKTTAVRAIPSSPSNPPS